MSRVKGHHDLPRFQLHVPIMKLLSNVDYSVVVDYVCSGAESALGLREPHQAPVGHQVGGLLQQVRLWLPAVGQGRGHSLQRHNANAADPWWQVSKLSRVFDHTCVNNDTVVVDTRTIREEGAIIKLQGTQIIQHLDLYKKLFQICIHQNWGQIWGCSFPRCVALCALVP